MKIEQVRAKMRKLVPNTWFTSLTYNPLIKLIFRAADLPGKLIYREFESLPPNELRCRVGVNGRYFNNQVMYLTHGVNLWFYLLGTGKVGFDSSIVEIGCGCGRRTHLLRDFETNGVRFNGQYLGIDIDNELLEWCRRNFDPERFDFFQSPHGSSAYRGAEVKTELRIPRDDNSTDLVFGTSVLTHLLEPEMSEYFSEASRILRPGRCLVMTCKCIDRNVKTFGNTYPHRIGNAYVQSSSTPEAAVAYESEFLLSFIKERGFSNAEILVGDGDIQHLLIATK